MKHCRSVKASESMLYHGDHRSRQAAIPIVLPVMYLCTCLRRVTLFLLR